MIAVILSGGLGTRISNETINKPKPLVLLNKKPIISYIISHYRNNSINQFCIAGGYKYKSLNSYFRNLKDKNIFFDNSKKKSFDENIYKKFLESTNKKKYFLKVVDTGLKTLTGGRVAKLRVVLEKYEYFFLTYGDGLSNINILKSLNEFKKNNSITQVTAVKSPPRFGEIIFNNKNYLVKSFEEKPHQDSSWINGGFFVVNNEILKYVKKSDNFEKDTLPRLVKKKKLAYYKHHGYWQCMDTPRDKIKLEKDLRSGKIKF